ncbi:MAG: class I SAM-dependent methyltransferase [Flavobacteriaceae bacterium]|jgi:predicted O-methyltransferase YrrM|nr:class I SAM-dependent methyltransferase [Flavobacteriaceae bacterium]
MKKELKEQILELYQQLKKEDSTKENRLDRWRNLEPESAELIAIIIRSQQSKKVLELGTSNGFSTLWFADALQSIGGQLTTIEIEATRTEKAKQHLKQFNLLAPVELITMDALLYLEQANTEFDLIFLDAERSYYISYWPHLDRLLQKPGSLLIVDNVISHQEQVKDFIALIRRNPNYTLTIDPIGAGLLMVTKV